MQGNRPGTSRPVTSGGRFVRLGTASMLSEPGGPFINIERLDLKKYAQRPALAKILCDYIIYQLHNPRKALELASLATVAAEYKDWWWKARLGKCYYQLGLLRDNVWLLKPSLNGGGNGRGIMLLDRLPLGGSPGSGRDNVPALLLAWVAAVGRSGSGGQNDLKHGFVLQKAVERPHLLNRELLLRHWPAVQARLCSAGGFKCKSGVPTCR